MSEEAGYYQLIYEVLLRIAVALESKTSSRPLFKIPSTTSFEDPYGVMGIKWFVGGGQNKKMAGPEEGYAWAFIYDREGIPHIEVEKLLPALTSAGGKLETAGYIIQLGGNANQLLSARAR